jgi:peptidyl-prolyl cis-trans isomerase SurA
MHMTESVCCHSRFFLHALRARWALCTALAVFASQAGAQARAPVAAVAPNTADFIVAVVNQELVTNGELQQRIARISEGAVREKTPLPPPDELRQQVLDVLINERVQVTNARETGQRLDEAELDRAVLNVAVQNKMTLPQLRERLQQQGIAFTTFRNNLRDQMMVERVREREVNSRIRISNDEVEAALDRRRAAADAGAQLNLAQVLVTVPEGASPAEVSQRRARAEAAMARVKAGEPFEAVAREISEDGNRAQGGVIGLRPSDRLPDVFVNFVKTLKAGEVAPTLLRSGAGFHILKLIERSKGAAAGMSIQQTRARHILLRPSAQLTQDAAVQRLAEFKRTIVSGTKTFEQLAIANSEDSSASRGGELGWSSPGMLVPEFEDTMNGLPINGISDPIISRFGVHLIQVQERRETLLDEKQQREQVRNVLREQKFEEAYLDWIRDLRGRAYVELREPPQ